MIQLFKKIHDFCFEFWTTLQGIEQTYNLNLSN